MNEPVQQNKPKPKTKEEIAILLGKYTLEAMETIDKDNFKRREILKSSESSENDKKETLQSGVWYSEEYLPSVKQYNETRFQRMIKKDVLKEGYMPNELWERDSRYEFSWKNIDDTSSSKAILDIVEGKTLCLLDCMAVFNVAQYFALLKIWGKEKFDCVFSGKEAFTLPIRITPYDVVNPIYLFLEGEEISALSAMRIGDKIGIRNHPDYKLKHLHPHGTAISWNIVSAELTPEVRFTAFGFDGKRLSDEELKTLLIDLYNLPPFSDEEILPGMAPTSCNQDRLFDTSFPKTIDRTAFDLSTAGYDFLVVRLSAERVKMVLDMPLESSNLLDIFRAASPGIQKYAMNSETKASWEHESLVTEGFTF